ncbi:ABC transporter permease [Streptomyces sp. ACA25]|uniref:ABC transporter permease n=1 Tax=Streptomyces sp. ACA25 TaxID=3022596 RepID=UPI0023081DE0|nr:ABC transporter permease [Streptomyces sp. ACA25]MDB1086027.1 ABC transporter permease [Streptomyces sp. ACA25]
MSTATALRTEPERTEPPRGGNTLAGTGTLIRFALRRDRVRLPVWIGALLLGTLVSAVSFEETYPDAAGRQAIAETTNSPAGLAMSGPAHYLTDYQFGSMLSHQMLSFVAVLVALMSVLIVTRHTRNEEETGRAELVRSSVVGRHAYLTAALTVALLANLVLGALLAAALSTFTAEGYTTGGALLYGAAHTAIGLVFAGIAAITAQITAHSRGASGMALATVGAAYALRAAGDAAGEGGVEWMSWLSPIGWIQRTYAFVDNRWWPLLLCLALAAATAAVGYALSTRRDLGSGLRPTRPGSPRATEALSRPIGFALRLHRGLLIGFAAALLLLGAMYGSILGEAEAMIEGIDMMEEALAQLGGATVAESVAAMVLTPISAVAAVYVVMAGLRPRSEETSGRAEPVLSTGLSRAHWAGSHLAIALAGGTLVMLLGGFSLGATGWASTGDASLLPKLLGASLAYAPALWVTAGITMVLFGWFPRAAPAAWAIPLAAFLIGYLGTLLNFPQWVMNLDAFGHVPQLPAATMSWTPLLILTAFAAGLMWLGLTGFRRRDLDLT